MELQKFKVLYKKFTSPKLDRSLWQTQAYADYCDAIGNNEVIADWYLKQQIKKSKVKVGKHCCTKMTYYLTFDKKTKDVNPDAVIRFNKKSKDYGIPVHDGGQSYIGIEHCPWCGKRLAK
ncbi:DUF6980 family protein [Ohtaekwangia koreensis]|uniref:DUF6980 domain-containing protein n=1 Tax=Ohtaekwangia koreensis TaxID=688867 RepID=A0A1T5MN16_9BACT|nr:hypothetical protein [Ohtaekwangia koreensis]SKC89596.1 hypothetical protein SAMN05660236_5893 [Ohtaekwangia koreensis]